MADKFTKLHETFAGNAYPAMLRDLATHLGVTAESLQQLEIGWVPIVPFKKGPNYRGWWTIPERDSSGRVTGLSLRARSGMKVMYPGSKHGLTYAVNPEHETGADAYRPGPHNWHRTSDDLPCVVCGKPDGCLLSADDLDHPRAAICRVTKAGAAKPMKFGWLHILRPEGNLKPGARVLPESDLPVLVVEGMTDTAAAMDMGFVAVGRPSNLAGMERLKDVVRGRDVIIIGENDQKEDGSRPGEEGMLAAFQVLKTVCKNIKKVMPPEAVKDLRQWRNTYALTDDQLVAYADAEGDDRADYTVIPDERDLTVARTYLMDRHRMAGRYTLRCFNNVWFQYRGGKYEYVPDLRVMNPLYQWAHDKYMMIESSNGESTLQRVKATKQWVTNIAAAMNSETEIVTPQAPCWINDQEGPDPNDLITFANGIMHVPTYLNGGEFDDYMIDLSPDLFTLSALPFAFDPAADCPSLKKWARSSLGDDAAKIRLAQEFAGYCMTCDISHQKLLWLRGVPASGKSLFLNTMRYLVGDDQFAIIKIRHLTERFGMAHMIGKLVAAMPDLRMPKYADSMVALESVLNIVGGDPVPIERKFKDTDSNVRLTSRFIISSNELPQFADPTGALKRRLLLLEFKRSFEGREDRTLERKFTDEVPGIAVWALEGLRRLRRNGDFTVPQSMAEVLHEWHRDNSPVSTFIEECVDYGPDQWVEKKHVYEAFRAWAGEHGHFPCSLMNFKQRWADRMPTDVRPATVTHNGHKYSVYTGVRLVPWAEKQYLGKPLNS